MWIPNKLADARKTVRGAASTINKGNQQKEQARIDARTSKGLTAPPAGMSQQAPGVAEQKQQLNEKFYNTPGAGEKAQGMFAHTTSTPMRGERSQYGVADSMLGPGVGQAAANDILAQGMGNLGGANPAAQAYQEFQQRRPDLASDPGLDPYYQNAQRKALEGINQNAAARGVYGSSAAMDMGNEAITNLRAEQANREADYNLQRMAEQRGWEGLGGQLAGQQSASQLGWAQGMGNLGLGAEGMDLARQQGAGSLYGDAQQNALARMGLGYNMASDAQRLGLSRMGQGFGEAALGQGLRDQRIQSMLSNMLAREQLYAPLATGWGQGLMGQDVDLMGAALGGQIGAAREGVNQQQARGQQLRGDISTGIGLAGAFGLTPGPGGGAAG